MWINFIRTMTAPRIGWLSAGGMIALALLGVAAILYAISGVGMQYLVVMALINLSSLSLDCWRNT